MITALLVLAGVAGVAALAASNLRAFRRAPAPPGAAPSVSVLIPARDEAAGIEAAVRAACAQRGVALEVIVLDDGSTDGTAEILARLAAELPMLRVVPGAPLPGGWAGKAWACWQLAHAHARGEWVCFADADVRLGSDAAARMVAAAERDRADFASAFPREIVRTAGEALLVPLIHLVLLAYLPMRLIRSNPMPALSAGCGQLMVARRAAYLAADGHRAVRATLHDGIALARRMKATGHGIAVVDGTDLATCRMYDGFAATWRGFARNAYEALGSPGALATMALLNVGLFVLPFAALAASPIVGARPGTTAAWAASVALIVALRLVLAARFRAPWWIALATPLAVLAMTAIQLHSYLNHWTGRPVIWRTRAYPGAAPSGET